MGLVFFSERDHYDTSTALCAKTTQETQQKIAPGRRNVTKIRPTNFHCTLPCAAATPSLNVAVVNPGEVINVTAASGTVGGFYYQVMTGQYSVSRVNVTFSGVSGTGYVYFGRGFPGGTYQLGTYAPYTYAVMKNATTSFDVRFGKTIMPDSRTQK